MWSNFGPLTINVAQYCPILLVTRVLVTISKSNLNRRIFVDEKENISAVAVLALYEINSL